MLRANRFLPEDQAAYYGFVKPKEAQVPVPDLRIEYESRDGKAARVDLELVTEHYRPGQLAETARAGFSLYASPAERDHPRRVLEQRELTAEILTL